ncbi:3-keto-disaccharide hydrolase [Spirosoma lituiforme]
MITRNILISLGLLATLAFTEESIPVNSGDRPVAIQLKTSQTDGWKPLFNGNNLDGWKHVGKGKMLVEKGMIRGSGGMGLLYWSKEKLSNCTLRVVYRMQKENSNSGVYIRIPLEPREEWMPVHYGYEVQIDNHPETSNEDEYHVTGTLYSLTKPLAKPGKPGPQWNTMDITLDGPRTIVSVNGVKVTDYREGDPVPPRKFDFEPYHGLRPDTGYIGLQNHGKDDVVYFKEVSVKPLVRK